MIMRKKYYVEKPTEIEEVVEQKKYKTVKSKPAEWKPSRHSKMLFDYCFKNWGLKS